MYMKIGVYGSASENTPLSIEDFEYPFKICQNPQKSTLNKVRNEGYSKSSINQLAREVGREIARKGHILVTGGCPGFPYEANLGAYEEGGHTIAYSPATSIEDHIKRFSFPIKGIKEFVFIPTSFEYN